MHSTAIYARKQKNYMKLFIRLCTACLITFAFLFPVYAIDTAPAKDVYEDVFLYAQHLEQGGALEEAEVEYKRYLFLQDFSRGIHQTSTFKSLAQLYAKKEQWQLAADTMKQAIQSSIYDGQNSQDTDLLRLKHIQYLSHLEDSLYIFSYINFAEYSQEVRRTAFLTDFKSCIIRGLWQGAREKFDFAQQEFQDLFTPEEVQIINTSLQSIFAYKPKKQLLAGYLSFIPGLGQLYAGDPLDALNAFVLNGSLIAVSAWSICTLDLWTFSLLEFNPLVHFMQGNIYNAQKDAYEYNQKKLKGFSDQILQIVDAKIH